MAHPAGFTLTRFSRSETHILLAISILLLLIALAMSYFAALDPLLLSLAQSLDLQKVRLGFISLGSVGALSLGLLLAMKIARGHLPGFGEGRVGRLQILVKSGKEFPREERG